MKQRLIKIGLTTLGFITLIVGIIGVFIPLLPTTPFLLISAACFMRSSERLYNWLLNHRLFGKTIRGFREHHAIPLRTKILAVCLLWVTILASAIFYIDLLWIRIILLGIAIGVTIHILHFKTLDEVDDQD